MAVIFWVQSFTLLQNSWIFLLQIQWFLEKKFKKLKNISVNSKFLARFLYKVQVHRQKYIWMLKNSFLPYFVNSQIWLNSLIDDCDLGNITKLKRKKHRVTVDVKMKFLLDQRLNHSWMFQQMECWSSTPSGILFSEFLPSFSTVFQWYPLGITENKGKKSEHVFMLDKALDRELSRNQIHTQLLLGGALVLVKPMASGFALRINLQGIC